jgi:hypothetical protein
MWIQYEETPDGAYILSFSPRKQESLSADEGSIKSSSKTSILGNRDFSGTTILDKRY